MLEWTPESEVKNEVVGWVLVKSSAKARLLGSLQDSLRFELPNSLVHRYIANSAILLLLPLDTMSFNHYQIFILPN